MNAIATGKIKNKKMRASETINKSTKLNPSEDYNFLRREGIKHIEKLAGDVWTDYNTHDPGITLLENLCYAITDLAYRTGFDMKDLLAKKDPNSNMKDETTVNSKENILNVTFTEVDKNENEIKGGIKKHSSLRVKYFKEGVRSKLMGKNINDYVITQLDKAFAKKELDFILSDLGLDKNDSAASQKYFKIQITRIGLLDANNWKNIFYTAREILPCNPVTINDFRKLLIDIDGVRNAWITISKDYEVPIFLDKESIIKNFDIIKEQQDKEQETQQEIVSKTDLKLPQKEDIKAVPKTQSKIVPKGDEKRQPKEEPGGEPPENQEDDSCCGEFIHLPATVGDSTFGLSFSGDKVIELNGLYKIIVEYEEDIIEKKKEDEVRKEVLKVLHRHRNICEDFLSVTGAEYKDFFLQTEVRISESADADMILAEMCYRIQNYFTPVIRFYSLDEMESSGMPVDEIFEGPPLKHGFIRDDKLEETDMFRDMRLSDIINFISDIEGVNMLERFKIVEAIKEPETDEVAPDKATPPAVEHDPCSNEDFFADWIDKIKKEKLVGRLSIDDMLKFFHPSEEDLITPVSMIYFKKPSGEVIINTDRFQKLLNDLKGRDKYMKMEGFKNNYPVPAGENMELNNFYPVQYQLPFTYRVGKESLPLREGKERLIQSLQLKGYLAVFEQLFLNYLYLLDGMNEIFSFSDIKFRGKSEHKPFKSACEPDKEKTKKEEEPGEEKFEFHPPQLNQIIYKDEGGKLIEKIEGYKCLYYNAEKYLNELQATIQPESDFEWQRNIMLNHLLSRFNEQMDEYESLMKYMYPDDYVIRVIKNKTDLLADYPAISNYRMRAYNYKLEEEEFDYENASWDEEKIAINISGLEKRIARLIGLHTYRRRDLAPNNLFIKRKTAPDGSQTIKVVLYEDGTRDKEKILLQTKLFDAKCSDDIMHAFIDSGCCADNFKRYPEQQAPHRRAQHKQHHTEFSFVLKNAEGKELAYSPVYHSVEKRDEALKLAKCFLEKICSNEGFHMIEHILLRPKGDTQLTDEHDKPYGEEFKLLDICIDKCDLLVIQDSDVTVDYKFDLEVLPPEKCLDGKRWKVVLSRIHPLGTEVSPVKILEHTFKDFDLASDFISSLREYGSELINYDIYKTKIGVNYYFKIKDKNGKTLVESSCFKSYLDKATSKDKDKAIPGKRTECTDTVTGRGIVDEIAKLKEFLSNERDLYCCEESCNHNEDPYSFRVSFVLPCWPKRFRNKGFRKFVEKVIRAETPAHIQPKIFWLGINDMRDYEDAYFNWLVEISANDVPDIGISNKLINCVIDLKDCDEYCDDDEFNYSEDVDYDKHSEE
jgi:hypothetical protein